MKKNTFMSVVIAFIMSFGFSISAFANSSWVWVTESRPYDVLPFVIVFTLLSETFAISYFGRVESKQRVFIPVLVGNILSYLMPYVAYSNSLYGEVYGLKHALDHSPYYTVGIYFLVMTLAVELPVVYFALRNKSENKKVLAAAIIVINVLTTLAVAVIERLICRGQW